MRWNRPGRRGTPLLGALVIVASFVVAGYLWLQQANESQKGRIAYLEGLTSRLRSETVPLKFMILSREGGQVRARLKLYDLSGREVSTIEKSWPGSELYIDMLLLPVRSVKGGDKADSWLAFPYRVFTDSVGAASGTLLFDAYGGGGFPEVLRGVAWAPREEAAIAAAFASARRLAASGLPAAGSVPGSFGSAVHEVSKLAAFEPGLVYKVVCRVKGGVEIMED